MASLELIVHVMDAGSNNMSMFQALMGVFNNPRDSLSIMNTGATLIATVTNVTPILQPIRIITNSVVATTVLTRIVVDWRDPNKKVEPGDILTLVSASGMIVLSVFVLAEIGPGAAITINAIVMSSDLQSGFQPYITSAKVFLGNLLSNLIGLTRPASTASSSLYWGTINAEAGYGLYSYDEIMFAKGLFICMSDHGTSGTTFFPRGTPVPGSITPINEDAYKDDFCRNLAKEQGWSDVESGVAFCKSSTYQ
ncbi:hypothetical protein P3T18_003753 [Paraburkholderia sp. GAS199]|uniref:hypothetical protein n=1 Tax=Paraburkholderia sp. GAS199 TaxID=3035126 RepID=UPI003D1BC160